MTKDEIKNLRISINVDLVDHHLHKALSNLKTLVDETAQWELGEEYNRLNTSYGYMLKYLSQGVLDPQRTSILSQIVKDALTLTDKATIALLSDQESDIFYVRHKASKNISLQALAQEYGVERNKLSLINSVPQESRNSSAAHNITLRCEQLESEIFNKVWSTFPTPTADVEQINDILQNTDMPHHLKSLILSSLMLGLTRCFDETKLKLLLNSYATLSDSDLQLRALINAVIVLYQYNNRLKAYSEIATILQSLEQQPNFVSDLQLIFTRLINSRNTDNISRRMHEGIMPELQKMSPELLNKIKGKTPGTLDLNELEENPQWQEWLDKSGITRKLEEFNELQLEGSDVFISTFAKLKSYPFFNTMSNWFLPYHDECSAVTSAFGDKKHPLTSLFKVMPILCDSDKYSMLLSIASAPESQRQMMFSQFEAQKEQLKELETEGSQSIIKMRDNIVNRYIQDLYRFFKLFSRRREFYSIFETEINLMEVEWIRPYIGNTATLSVIAEFYFKNGFYNDAILYYRYMLGNHDASAHVYQKMGYCYQSLGKHREALRNYKRYEIVDGDDVWNIKQMAQCYRAIKDRENAIKCYEHALELSPENVNMCLNLGHCYLEKGDYDQALQQYYKADFMPKAKHRAWRPIAWCSLLTGKNEQSKSYYEKIFADDTPTSQDHLNYGHLLQVTGNIADAIEQYHKSLMLENGDIDAFSKLYNADAGQITSLGISYEDYALVLDATLQGFTSRN